jgi:hypothetical protein
MFVADLFKSRSWRYLDRGASCIGYTATRS